jgi:short-subunit dehydrogenase
VGKLIFITGASGGVGRALACRFYAAGYELALVARRVDEVEKWLADARIPGAAWRIYEADVAQTPSIIAAAQSCLRAQGLPEIVVANAGISIGMDTAVCADIDVMARMFATNCVGMAASFHPFVRAMQARGHGTLVGVGSVSGVRGLPGHGAYCASKAAVINYCESLRVELAPSGIKVVTLCPAYIDTPLTQGNRYRMPFLMEPEAFADKAFHAIMAGASYRVIPWQMGVLAKVLRLLPNAVFDRLVSSRGRKRRFDEA